MKNLFTLLLILTMGAQTFAPVLAQSVAAEATPSESQSASTEAAPEQAQSSTAEATPAPTQPPSTEEAPPPSPEPSSVLPSESQPQAQGLPAQPSFPSDMPQSPQGSPFMQGQSDPLPPQGESFMPSRAPLSGQLQESVVLPPQLPPQLPPLPQNYYRPAPPLQGQAGQWSGWAQQAPPLPGYANQSQMMPPQGQRQAPRMAPQAIPGQVSDRPNYLPGYAYTNDTMTAPYHNRDLNPFDRSPMPNHSQWMILANSVTKYWRGYHDTPCWVWTTPIATAPGHFTFRSRNPMGPRGWLEFMTKKSWDGFPMYRYWFDQR